MLVHGLVILTAQVQADDHVVVVADASDTYLERKFGGGEVRVETYVFMETKPYEGTTRDRSLERFSIRDIAASLAPELSKAHYMPATELKSADLMLAVHWGSTRPRITIDDILPNTPIGVQQPNTQEQQETAGIPGVPDILIGQQTRYQQLERSTDSFGGTMADRITADLLGYTPELARLTRKPFPTPVEQMLLTDLVDERYFVFVNAYDLRTPRTAGKRPRPVWTIHLNMRAAGQDFSKALAQMGSVAVNYFGQRVDGVTSVRASVPAGHVVIGPVTIIGIER